MEVIRAAWAVCSWNKVIRNPAIVIEGNQIMDILPWEEWKEKHFRAEKKNGNQENPIEAENSDNIVKELPVHVTDRRDSIVFPGFVNAHMHQYGILSHGIPQAGKVVDFKTFLENYWWPFIENRIRKEQVLVTAKATMAEMLSCGITSFCDILEAPYTEEDTLISQGELIEKTGMRAIVSLESSQRISDENGEACLRQNLEAVRFFQKKKGLVRGALCTHTTFTCTEDFIHKAAGYADQEQAVLQFHLSESSYEPRWSLERNGSLPAFIYDRAGALGERTIATQCVKVTREEQELLKSSGTRTVHMPISNCEVGGGIAPAPEMLSKGMETALGTDGYVNDFFQVMRQAFLIHKAALESTKIMGARQVFCMATEYGAKAMGLEDCGILAPGYKADMVIYQDRQLTPVTENNIYDQLVVYGNSSFVTDVIIDGKWVMKEKMLITIDKQKAGASMRQCAKEFWEDIRS